MLIVLISFFSAFAQNSKEIHWQVLKVIDQSLAEKLINDINSDTSLNFFASKFKQLQGFSVDSSGIKKPIWTRNILEVYDSLGITRKFIFTTRMVYVNSLEEEWIEIAEFDGKHHYPIKFCSIDKHGFIRQAGTSWNEPHFYWQDGKNEGGGQQSLPPAYIEMAKLAIEMLYPFKSMKQY